MQIQPDERIPVWADIAAVTESTFLPDPTQVEVPQAGVSVPQSSPVAVLLSTYNGVRFLQPQLDSIAQQNYGNWRVLWRDDGSIDQTHTMVEAFAQSVDGPRCVEILEPSGHLGITQSFLALLRQVPEGTMAAFADQDDVWLPDKLARGVAALEAVPSERPALYYARQCLVDHRLSPLGLSPHPGLSAGFPAALTQNVATGCTILLNPAAVALIAASHPPEGTLHDWWSYLLVSAVGGQLIGDPVPAVLYRQHVGNAVGAPHARWLRGIHALRRGPSAFMHLFRLHVTALLECGPVISLQAASDLRSLAAALDGHLWARLHALRQVRGLLRQTRSETVLFWVWFLIG